MHFPECALSGYAGVDFKTLDGFNWDLLKEQTQKIMSLAGKLKIWVVLGSIHRLTGAEQAAQLSLPDRAEREDCRPLR